MNIIAAKNLNLLKFQFFFWGWLPENVILIIYFGELLNSYAVSGIVFMLRYFCISLFEIPTGIISDKYGRRRSLILSSLCYSLVKICYLAAFYINPLLLLVFSSIFYGLAESLSSGTNDAIVYENVKKIKNLPDFADYYGKIKACHILGLGISALLGGLVAAVFSLYAVMLLSLFGTFLQLYFSWKLKETGFEPSAKKYLPHFYGSCQDIWHNGSLKTLLTAAILNGAGSRGQSDVMPLYLETLIPYWLMGIWRFSGRAINFFSFWFIQLFIKKFGFKKCFIWSVVTAPVADLVGLAFNNILTPFIFLTDFFLHGIKYTSVTKIKQDEFTDTQRATMESIYSMSSNVVSGLAVLLIGIIAQYLSAYWAILAALLFKFAALPFYWQIYKKYNG